MKTYNEIMKPLLDFAYPNGFWNGYATFFSPACNKKIGREIVSIVYDIINGDSFKITDLIDILSRPNAKQTINEGTVICHPTSSANMLINILNQISLHLLEFNKVTTPPEVKKIRSTCPDCSGNGKRVHWQNGQHHMEVCTMCFGQGYIDKVVTDNQDKLMNVSLLFVKDRYNDDIAWVLPQHRGYSYFKFLNIDYDDETVDRLYSNFNSLSMSEKVEFGSLIRKINNISDYETIIIRLNGTTKCHRLLIIGTVSLEMRVKSFEPIELNQTYGTVPRTMTQMINETIVVNNVYNKKHVVKNIAKNFVGEKYVDEFMEQIKGYLK